LTPHPGEASRLLDVSVKQIESNRYQSCNDIGINFNSVCLLKGAGTVICKSDTQDSKLWVCDAGNPGMATAGMGDLLTGVIGTFLAQGYSPENAAVFAVCAHAEAGDRVATQYGQRGMISSDLLQPLRAIFNGL
jgi:NAD(P)H-hydrate epimerase